MNKISCVTTTTANVENKEGEMVVVGGGSSVSSPSSSASSSPTRGAQHSVAAQGSVDARGAAIEARRLSRANNANEFSASKDDVPTIVLPNQQSRISHLAIDIGGTLIKMVYFSTRATAPPTSEHAAAGINETGGGNDSQPGTPSTPQTPSGRSSTQQSQAMVGRLHFVRFETAKIEECIAFIESKGLHLEGESADQKRHVAINATGGGAHKFTELFKERLGLRIRKLDEMGCLVDGANFLLRAVRDEAFTFSIKNGRKYVKLRTDTTPNVSASPSTQELFPYLLVNIGSGVSMVRVDGPGKWTRVSGSTLGGGAFFGLCRLLTGCQTFDEMLELSRKGDNTKVDMMVGDIYGGRAYETAGLSADTIASSFGKIVMQRGSTLADYSRADLELSLLRMVSYNIGQIAHLNAIQQGLKRVFFGGYFIRSHTFTMDIISFAIDFWSKGEMQALFMRHEGFLGAIGAFMSAGGAPGDKLFPGSGAGSGPGVWIERFPMGAPVAGGDVFGPPIETIEEKIGWVEKFVSLSRNRPNRHGLATPPGETVNGKSGSSPPGSPGKLLSSAAGAVNSAAQAARLNVEAPSPNKNILDSNDSNVAVITPNDGGQGVNGSDESRVEVLGVLHLCEQRIFPLLSDPAAYEPNTVDISGGKELEYWTRILMSSLPALVERAVRSEGGTEDAQRRGDAMALALRVHINRWRAEPSSYGRLGLADVLELREDCLREFSFNDAYRIEKADENSAAMAVWPELIKEIDSLDREERLRSLVEGILAGNIFDWGSSACVALYQNGSILDIYRQARAKLARPFLVDNFDKFAARALGDAPDGSCLGYRRVLIFCDNSGADCVLGVLPFARELVRAGAEVGLVANSLPALNDVTAAELVYIVAAAAEHCPILRSGAINGGVMVANGCGAGDATVAGVLRVLPSGHGGPCIDLRRITPAVAEASAGVDLVVLEGMGRAVHTNLKATFTCDSLKLAMIKNKRLAESMGGDIYDCVCCFQRGGEAVVLPKAKDAVETESG